MIVSGTFWQITVVSNVWQFGGNCCCASIIDIKDDEKMKMRNIKYISVLLFLMMIFQQHIFASRNKRRKHGEFFPKFALLMAF